MAHDHLQPTEGADEPKLGPGDRIGAYRLEARLGRGGMGEVWRASNPLGRAYALKLLRAVNVGSSERFLVEARFASALDHPNVVRVHDLLRYRDLPVLVMDLARGGDLARFLTDRSPLEPPQIDALARGIFAGLRAIHAFGAVHRDLKPLNILLQPVDRQVVPMIGDFGLAKVLAVEGMTRPGTVFGSLNYMAPEQALDARGVDSRADLFALGCVLYELVTLQQAFPGDDFRDVGCRVLGGSYRPVRWLRPDCPERMLVAIEGCLEPRREERIPDVDEREEVWTGHRHRPRSEPRSPPLVVQPAGALPTLLSDLPDDATFEMARTRVSVEEPVAGWVWAVAIAAFAVSFGLLALSILLLVAAVWRWI